ncbi:hypothetical protein PHAVU_002G009300 [Phaseolus vulgaris]|uniref:Phytosulfokine n=1 Tax=Phaseolus vulgaris TaxID=3885 RepID=V7CEU0_PHAVU|nr:hypothetical protein PHAVU_002G009300g [Phaseolus vulgaris]ESW28687.1 hypothetical protein PHAVU_002G009300g [Phaseolus vulgaris]
MRKVTALLFMALFLSCMITTHAARSKSSFGKINPDLLTEDSCDDTDDEECLKRRTLAANLDYIYTQDEKN